MAKRARRHEASRRVQFWVTVGSCSGSGCEEGTGKKEQHFTTLGDACFKESFHKFCFSRSLEASKVVFSWKGVLLDPSNSANHYSMPNEFQVMADWTETADLTADRRTMLYGKKMCRALWAERTLTDFVVRSDSGKEWSVHRCVLAAASPILGRMVVGEMLEAKTGLLHIKEVTDDDAEAFLKFVYTGELDTGDPQDAQADAGMSMLFLPMCLSGMPVLQAIDCTDDLFCSDNSALQADTTGLGFRKSMVLEDLVSAFPKFQGPPFLLKWGNTVRGTVVDGNGTEAAAASWLKVDGRLCGYPGPMQPQTEHAAVAQATTTPRWSAVGLMHLGHMYEVHDFLESAALEAERSITVENVVQVVRALGSLKDDKFVGPVFERVTQMVRDKEELHRQLMTTFC